jgi:hypothetical protein
MIHVDPAPEPVDFDEKVRQPGLSAIAELVGEPPLKNRPGPRRTRIASRREDIPSSAFPDFWRLALDDLLRAYHRVCAYVSIYIEPVTGAPSVDHLLPKSQRWDAAYEWNNYRLGCSLMNSRKGIVAEVLDPFAVENGWFVLELVGFQMDPAAGLDAAIHDRVTATIEKLGLNDRECRELRAYYAQNYWENHISYDYLRQRAPFVARELQRQGRLRGGDR